MVLVSYKEFVEYYLTGRKLHSFRKGSRWKAGMEIQFQHPNTKTGNMEKFMENGICTSVQVCKMVLEPSDKHGISARFYMFLDGWRIPSGMLEEIAYRDGFANTLDFILFFFPNAEPGVWDGQLIHWADITYNEEFYKKWSLKN